MLVLNHIRNKLGSQISFQSRLTGLCLYCVVCVGLKSVHFKTLIALFSCVRMPKIRGAMQIFLSINIWPVLIQLANKTVYRCAESRNCFLVAGTLDQEVAEAPAVCTHPVVNKTLTFFRRFSSMSLSFAFCTLYEGFAQQLPLHSGSSEWLLVVRVSLLQS